MKIYISVDMEGIACVTAFDHVVREDGGREYEMARKWLTAEVNAAIEGALEVGAQEVVVADSHGRMDNLLPDELHEDAILIRGHPRPLDMVEGVDETFDAAFLVGYHSMAGTDRGVLSHTWVRTVYTARLNGITIGEAGYSAAVIGHFGVPLALITGDDTVCAEVEALIPGIEQVVTKQAISTFCARNLTPKASQKRIRAGAKQALTRLSAIKPLTFETPIRLEMEFSRWAVNAAVAAEIPGVERIGGRAVAYTGADMMEVNKMMRAILNITRGESFY
jgi:D-amino peptidase